MKKFLLNLMGLVFLVSFFFFIGCKTDEPEPEGGSWTEADKQSHDQVLNVQDEVGENLDDWFQTMDSLDAIQQAYQAFVNSEFVSNATINGQGIAVQYTNGMRGGLFLNPKDDKSEVGTPMLYPEDGTSENNLKSLVNQKKMILINPHYFERSYYTDQIYSITGGKLGKVGMELSTFYKNQEATVDRFTELSGYGIIQIYSHGWAWPKQENITDVYLLTGETANDATSKKYWDELKKGNIPVMKVAGPNKYLVSPKFIADHNDFSNDTILFFGGFCYSFLGDWPDIIDGFADGAYLGYDWSVYTHKNANWSVNSIALMSDTSMTSPMTLEGWMQDPSVEKSYWNEKDSRYVHIHYTGDGNLKLWDDVSVSLKALSADGAPVSVPGEAGEAYPFRCDVITNISPLEYVWDIGDGSEPVKASNEVNITWSNDGTYELSVTVLNKNTGALLGTARLTVTIGNESNEIIDILKQCNYTVVYLRGSGTIDHWGFFDCSWTVDGQLDWNGLNFSGSSEMNGLTKTISGSVSSSGQTISFTVVKEGNLLGYDQQIKLSMTVENYPLDHYQYNFVEYKVDPPGGTSYVTNFEGYITGGGETTYLSTANFHWDALEEFEIYFSKSN
jgi:hypothetical protein